MTPWPDFVVGLLLLASGAVVLAAGIGLWRLPDFFARMHAPALASSTAIVLILVLLGLAAPVAIVFGLAIAPPAFALACAGAFVGLDR